MVYPALFQESPADHTYVKFANGVTFPCAGGCTGGEIDMNNKANDYLKNINKIIGDDKYEKLFNAKPSEEIILFDEKEFNSMLENVKNSLSEQFKNNKE